MKIEKTNKKLLAVKFTSRNRLILKLSILVPSMVMVTDTRHLQARHTSRLARSSHIDKRMMWNVLEHFFAIALDLYFCVINS
jgi:hypothetical protein